MGWLDKVTAWLRPKPAPAKPTQPRPLIDAGVLQAAAPRTPVSTLQSFLVPLQAACDEFAINTPTRVAAFVAQIAHESDGFRTTREYADGSAYEGRRDLGNVTPGDGKRYRGRGLIQITGRLNYRDVSLALFGDERLLIAPHLLERTDLACRASAYWWRANGCNELADRGDFRALTKRINGGYNGLADRETRWAAVKAEMGVA